MNTISVNGQSDDIIYAVIRIDDTIIYNDEFYPDQNDLEFTVGKYKFQYYFGDNGWTFECYIHDEDSSESRISLTIHDKDNEYAPTLFVESEYDIKCDRLIGTKAALREIADNIGCYVDDLEAELRKFGILKDD